MAQKKIISKKRQKENELCALSAAIVVAAIGEEQNTRSMWTRDSFLHREEEGFFGEFNTSLRNNDPKLFNNFARMKAENFDELLGLVEHRIKKQETHLRKTISAAERLAVCIRYLATGDNFSSLSFLFRMSKQTIAVIIDEAIYSELKNEYLRVSTHVIKLSYKYD